MTFSSKFTAGLVICSLLGLSATSSAQTITFDESTLAAGNRGVGSDDLGTRSVSLEGSDGTLVTVASTGRSANNLFADVVASTASRARDFPVLGIIGGGAGGNNGVKGGSNEQMTLSFPSGVAVSSITFSGCGKNDDNLIITGLDSDPGAVTFSTLGTATVTTLDYDYNADTHSLIIDFLPFELSTGDSFAGDLTVSFQNPVGLTSFAFSADQTGANANGVGIHSVAYKPVTSFSVSVRTTNPRWTISPYLVGIHQVYSFTPDSNYADGSIAAWAKRAGVSASRFPGGTVVKFWDWEDPTGVLNGDAWDPNWDTADNAPASDWMSLDEYLAFLRASGVAPIFGVNALSGQTHGREADSIARAVRMVQYVKERGYGGALWYVGNEESHEYPGGLSGYARVFQRHVTEMKAVDPDIRVFWNFNNPNAASVRTFLDNDGGTADGLETHGKWPYGGTPNLPPGTFEEWLVEVPIRDRRNNNRAWRFAANTYRQAAAEAGRPDLLIANNEYGLGSGINILGFTRYTRALLMTETLMEHFIGNWFSSCYWDLTRPGEGGLLLQTNQGTRLGPLHIGMDLLANAQSGEYLGQVTTTNISIHGFAALKDGAVLLYLLNKTLEPATVNLQLDAAGYTSTSARSMVDSSDHFGNLVNIPVTGTGTSFTATLSPLSFTEFVFADTS